MPIYKYKFCDGTTSEVDVSEEHFALLKELDKEEKQSDRRNKRQAVPKKLNAKSEVDSK